MCEAATICRHRTVLQILQRGRKHGVRDPPGLSGQVVIALGTIHKQGADDPHFPLSADECQRFAKRAAGITGTDRLACTDLTHSYVFPFPNMVHWLV